MKVTFPHIGKAYIPVKLMLTAMGIQTAVPELNNTETLEKGSKISPGEICLPFKLMMGNLIDGYSKGADTAIMTATKGPCRLGQYSQIMSDILNKNNCSMEWIILDSPNAIGTKELERRIKVLAGNNAALKTARIFNKARMLMKKTDMLEQQCFFMAGYVKNPAELISLRRNLFKELERADSFRQAFEVVEYYENMIDRIKVRRHSAPVRVVLTGEIYTCIEPYANHNIEELLINMGVSFQKTMTLSRWVHDTVRPKVLKPQNSKYIPYEIGGYAHETVKTIDGYKASGFDGIIQLMPAGCMPEIVAKTVFENNTEKKNLQILHMVFDEMTGEAGYITRLESFADMLEAGKRREKR